MSYADLVTYQGLWRHMQDCLWRHMQDLNAQLKAKDDRIAELEAFVAAFDAWRNGLRLAQETIRGADSTWNEQETCLRLLEARDRVGKVG